MVGPTSITASAGSFHKWVPFHISMMPCGM
jgi:hypothetical protein